MNAMPTSVVRLANLGLIGNYIASSHKQVASRTQCDLVLAGIVAALAAKILVVNFET